MPARSIVQTGNYVHFVVDWDKFLAFYKTALTVIDSPHDVDLTVKKTRGKVSPLGVQVRQQSEDAF